MEPISSGIQGLRGRWLAHDRDEADAGFAVSIRNSQDDLDAYRTSELFEQEAQTPLADYFVDEFRTYDCEVDVGEDVGEGTPPKSTHPRRPHPGRLVSSAPSTRQSRRGAGRRCAVESSAV